MFKLIKHVHSMIFSMLNFNKFFINFIKTEFMTTDLNEKSWFERFKRLESQGIFEFLYIFQ